MALQIIWTEIAEEQFEEILRYWIERNGSTTFAVKLNMLIDKTVQILSRYPESGRKTNFKDISVKIVGDYFLYYSHNTEFLYIVAICDMRRDSEYIKKLLE